MSASGLHAIALSEEVTNAAPLGVSVGEQAVVLWRDGDGLAHALEDRCPHRRAPLSLGCVRTDGTLRCGYHGWSFDGSGRVIDIPQLRESRRLPPVYRARAYPLEERDGFVWIDAAATGTLSRPAAAPSALPLTGTGHHAIEHGRFIALLLDGPHLLFGFAGVRITEYPLADPELRGDRIVYERACRRIGGIMPDRLRGDLPITLAFAIDPVSGFTRLALKDDAHATLVEAAVSPTPGRRGTTAIRWRARAHRRPRRGAPFGLAASIDGAALAAVPQDLSRMLNEERAPDAMAWQA